MTPAGAPPDFGGARTPPDNAEALLTRLRALLTAHEREGAVVEILRAVDAGLRIEELYDEVLVPMLVELGAGWQAGAMAVWEEHLATQAIRTAVEALYPRVLVRKAAVRAVPVTVAFFCLPDEAHDLGLRMLADRCDLRGFRTVYVGASTPVEEMVACSREVGADAVCLSVSTHLQRAALKHTVSRLAEELPAARIVVGGAAFAHDASGWERFAAGDTEALLDELERAAGA